MPSSTTLNWDDLQTNAHAWHLSPDSLQADVLRRECLPWLSTRERSRLEQFRTPALKHVYLATRALCRATLSRYMSVDPADWVFAEASHGKPRIAAPARFRSLRFNLSHTDGLIVCLVTRAAEVGVDVEKTSRAVDIPQVTRHFFSEDERRRVEQSPPSKRAVRFFETWVLKEAYLKGRGLGLSRPPESISIRFDDANHPKPIGAWQLALHHPTKHYVAATAILPRDRGKRIRILWRGALPLFPVLGQEASMPARFHFRPTR